MLADNPLQEAEATAQTDHHDHNILAGVATIAFLLVILTLGAYLRFVGLDWDEGHHLHPDERFLSQVVSAMHSVNSVGDYFDTQNSTLNPNNVGHGFFVYGNLPVIGLRYLAEELDKANYFANYLVGRALSGVADLLSIVVIFFVGRHLFDRRAGLIAAALYAGAALPIQQSHFFTVDAITNLFVVASFFFAARAFTDHRWIDYPLFGLMLGLAMASKVSIFPLAIILILALSLRVWKEIKDKYPPEDETLRLPIQVIRPLILRATIGLAIAGALTILIFRLAQPYAFLPARSGIPINPDGLGPVMTLVSHIGDPIGMRPNPLWLDQMNTVRQQVSGNADFPPNHQWGKRLPLIFPWVNMVRIGLGWPLGIFAWLAFLWAVWEVVRRNPRSRRLLLPLVWIGMYFTWQGIGWVKTMRYFLPVYPFLMLLAGWALITMWDRVQGLLFERGVSGRSWPSWIVAGIGSFVLIAGLLWGFAVSGIYTRPVTRVAASEWILENIPSDVTLLINTSTGNETFHVGLRNNWVDPAAPIDDPTQPTLTFTQLLGDAGRPFEFRIPVTGNVSRLRLTHVLNPNATSETRTLRVIIAADSEGNAVLAEATIVSTFGSGPENPRGQSYDVIFDTPAPLVEDQPYWLILEPDNDGPLLLSGSVVTNETTWDDPAPLPTAPYNLWDAQFHSFLIETYWEDTVDKRARLQYILDRSDYLVITSNRSYDSIRRNPRRWPMTLDYYEALFSGDLGFELVADFGSRPTLGPLEFFDDTAEEAWTVYDHPRVMIFARSSDYDPIQTAEVLGQADLSQVEQVIAADSVGRPRQLPVPAPRVNPQNNTNLATQQSTDSEPPAPGLYRVFQPLAIVVWWFVVALIGWAVFPLLWTLFTSLPDRGYGIARIIGLLLVGWIAWMLASIPALRWSGGTILFALIVVVAISLLAALPRRRAALAEWFRHNRSHVIFVEFLTITLFLLFLLVRWNNPDLWHPAFGGEKPMDLAYFNAILNSETFPPYDPWFTGGTINYYYFGFVIVGAPLMLVNIPVTLAYNIILPTLYAISGVAAFSVAFNLLENENRSVNRSPIGDMARFIRSWLQVRPGDATSPTVDRTAPSLHSLLPYFGGVAALLLAMVLGNLDEVRTLLWGLAELGSGTSEFPTKLLPNMGDTLKGLQYALAEGQLLPVGLGEWYWNATRLIPVAMSDTGQPLEIGPITEFPLFTFLYGDLHAHMIALPLTLATLVWCVAQLRSPSANDKRSDNVASPRSFWLVGGNVIFGALIVGALRPTNTWDWPTYMGIAMGTLALAHIRTRNDRAALLGLVGGTLLGGLFGGGFYLLNGPSVGADSSQTTLVITATIAVIGGLVGYGAASALNRTDGIRSLRHWWTLAGIILQGAALLGLTLILYLPYIQNYNLGYTSAIPWTGSQTPLWAYLDIHGLFLYIIVSWMAIETFDWLSASQKNENGSLRQFILPIIGIVALFSIVSAAIASRGYPVVLIVIPMIIWAMLLFIRPEQPTEKRFILALVAIAVALSMMVEVIVLQGDIGRMNTVFKFYLQVWVLLAVSSGAAIVWVLPTIWRARRSLRGIWLSGLAILLILAGLYTLLATRAKMDDRWAPNAPRTLDGMTYMGYAERYENGVVFSLRPDYQALRWMQENIQGTPIVLEAHTIEYQWGSRVTVYTGFPSVIGWNWHQRQQRPEDSEEVWRRVTNVETIYNTTSIDEKRNLLRRYDVNLIMLGELERAYYDPAGLAVFDSMVDLGFLRVLYHRDGTVVYEVIQDELSGATS